MKQTMVFGYYGIVDFAKKINSLNKRGITYDITMAKGVSGETVVVLSWMEPDED